MLTLTPKQVGALKAILESEVLAEGVVQDLIGTENTEDLYKAFGLEAPEDIE